jgi:hypothetical protein
VAFLTDEVYVDLLNLSIFFIAALCSPYNVFCIHPFNYQHTKQPIYLSPIQALDFCPKPCGAKTLPIIVFETETESKSIDLKTDHLYLVVLLKLNDS